MTTQVFTNVHNYVSVPKLWDGETVVCIGGGSSLTKADCDFVRGKARVIAIKEAAVCTLPGRQSPAPWADVLYACDLKYWRFEKGAPHFTGLKFALEPPVLSDLAWYQKWPDIGLLHCTGMDGLELEPTGLRTGCNSGYQTINLARHLGAKRTVLLAYDMWRGADGRQNWFEPHPNHVESPYPLFLQKFATIVEPLKAAGIEVINCSRFTVLSAFPRVPLEEVVW